ncbi:MAG: sigma-54-dependent Fis family transcriptional regulator, partial [Cryobacterium sp.]|nr:sigma-54-dependent Fis family transcriptional regulator [Oligoflexia bacterium]
ADALRRGFFEEADGGTIFFDEIANMPILIQAKLLRVLQEKEIVRMGSSRPIPLDFRVIAATNRSLEELAAKGEFLPDLIQRLNVLPISISPLRERLEDMPYLVQHFLETKSQGRIRMSESAQEALKNYSWPGNVRELSALIDYSIALTDDSMIELADLHPKIQERSPNSSSHQSKGPTTDKTFYDQMGTYEAHLLKEAYERYQGNISQLALALGMDRSHLHSKLKLHQIHSAKNR